MRIDEVVVPTEAQDEHIWEGSVTGKLTVKDAYHHYRDKGTVLQWRKKIWQQHIPPKVSMFIWKCIHNRLSTDDNANNKGVIVDGGCILCDDTSILEDQEHLLIHCEFSRIIWDWASTLLHLDLSFISSVTVSQR